MTESGRADTLRVVEAGLAPPAWMGPVAAAAAGAEAPLDEEKAAALAALQDYGKLVGAPELADVVLVVGGQRFPAHRGVLTARSAFFRGLLLSGMQEGGGQREVSIGEVSARAFRVVLRYLYTAALPSWEELQGAGREAEDDGAAGGSGGRGNGGSSKGGQGGAGGSKGKGKGKSEGKEAAGSEDEGRSGRGALALEVLKAADMLQAEGLLKHCLEAFRGGLTVHTAIEHLVWAHTEGPEEARGAAMAYVVQHMRAIQVAAPLTRVAHLHVAVSSGVFLFLFRHVTWWVLVTSIITANKRMRVEQTLTGVDVRRKTRRGRQGSWKRCL